MKRSPDFTFNTFNRLLDGFLKQGYVFQSLEDYIAQPANKLVILRHDVDARPLHSLQTAKSEHARGIRGTYYFRIVKQSNRPEIIRQIANLGHEIGYHYEDLALKHGQEEKAIHSFETNLGYFRTFYPVKTICMHGSPASRWDNRKLWQRYAYRDFGIIAEPYLDIDYSRMLYITDTGRKWNGDRSSVRDKVFQEKFLSLKAGLKQSDDILSALHAGKLPLQVMITVHPQRWSGSPAVWISEYISQRMKNTIKRLMFVR